MSLPRSCRHYPDLKDLACVPPPKTPEPEPAPPLTPAEELTKLRADAEEVLASPREIAIDYNLQREDAQAREQARAVLKVFAEVDRLQRELYAAKWDESGIL